MYRDGCTVLGVHIQGWVYRAGRTGMGVAVQCYVLAMANYDAC